MSRLRREYLAFAALALLLGPITSFTTPQWSAAMLSQTLAGGAIVSALAGIALILAGLARHESPLNQKQWLSLLFLLLPQILDGLLTPPYIRAWPWLHETPWGIVFLFFLASPLWLALLSALQLIQIEVPRAVAGATIAGIGAVCLTVTVDAYQVASNQWLVLLLHLALSIALVYAWTYARPRLPSTNILSAPGYFLLLRALTNTGLSTLSERPTWQPIDWHAAAIPLALGAVVTALSSLLWFWLLRTMKLAAFSMYPLATWLASALSGFLLFSFTNLRIDFAVAIALAAVVFALRSSVAGEQPTALGIARL